MLGMGLTQHKMELPPIKEYIQPPLNKRLPLGKPMLVPAPFAATANVQAKSQCGYHAIFVDKDLNKSDKDSI